MATPCTPLNQNMSFSAFSSSSSPSSSSSVKLTTLSAKNCPSSHSSANYSSDLCNINLSNSEAKQARKLPRANLPQYDHRTNKRLHYKKRRAVISFDLFCDYVDAPAADDDSGREVSQRRGRKKSLVAMVDHPKRQRGRPAKICLPDDPAVAQAMINEANKQDISACDAIADIDSSTDQVSEAISNPTDCPSPQHFTYPDSAPSELFSYSSSYSFSLQRSPCAQQFHSNSYELPSTICTFADNISDENAEDNLSCYSTPLHSLESVSSLEEQNQCNWDDFQVDSLLAL
jgi:hypothetical protein